MTKLLKSYFYWTYTRGSFHYDVMVTLILAFIFITPHLWNYGDKPAVMSNSEQIVVTADDNHGLVVLLQAADVNAPAAGSDREIRRALRRALEPISGDAVFVDRWELTRDQNGNPVSWKVWAHK